jgi:hypothetical protein
MSAAPEFVTRKDKTTWYLNIHVQPKAKKTEVAGKYGDFLKLRVQAPPVDNKANSAVAIFLAGKLGLKKSAVYISKGHKGRDKTFVVESEQEPDWLGLFT